MPGREPWYAFAAGFALVIIPSWISTGGTVGDWLNVLFGAAAVQVAIGLVPRNERLHHFLDRIGGRRGRRRQARSQNPQKSPRRRPRPRPSTGQVPLSADSFGIMKRRPPASTWRTSRCGTEGTSRSMT